MAGVIRGQSPLILAFENAPQLCGENDKPVTINPRNELLLDAK